MQLRFFTIPVHAGGDAASKLNQFLTAHRILAIDRHLVADSANSAWAVCVSFDEGNLIQRVPPSAAKPNKIDYKEVLTDPEFAVFARLRASRKDMAEKEAVPAYALFTNDHLAQIVQRRIITLTGLREIAGIGESRAEKYGEPFVAMMREAALPASSAASQPSPDET